MDGGEKPCENDDISVEEKKDIISLKEYIDELTKRQQWREQLRKQNSDITNRLEESELRKLDSSLKKNTAFVRKIRNFNESTKKSLMDEMQTLNLTKYLTEITTAIVEVKLKVTDIQSVIEICSLLHQRYCDFSQPFLEAWSKALSIKKDDKSFNISKLRVDLRLYCELVSVGIFPLKEGLSFLGKVLTTLIANDKDEHNNIAVILMFCRYCGDDFAGLVSQKMVNFANQYAFNIPKVHLLPHDKQKNVKALLKDYFESAAEHLKRLSKEIARIDRRNKEILMTKGDLDADKREQLNNMQLLSDKLNTSTESLADLLGEDMPDLTFRLESENKSDEEAFDNDEEDEEDKIDKQWEDDDTKSFYIDLIDIKAIVPGILFEAAKPDLDQNQADPPGSNPTADMASTDKSKIVEEQLDDIMDLEGLDGDDVLDPSNNFADDKEGIEDLEQDILKEEEMEKNEVGQNTSKKMLFDAFISNLPTCVNRVMIDNAAAEFCMTFNTKANRKKLVKALFSVNRNRIDLLPFYARFIATINPCAPDVSTDMSVLLKREFRWQVRKKRSDENRIKIKGLSIHWGVSQV